MSARTLTARATRLALLAVPLLLVACGGGAATTTATARTAATPAASPRALLPTPIVANTGATATPVPVGPPPSPETVSYASEKLIGEWQALGIPQYPGARKLDFQAAGGSSVQNAGTMLFQTSDSPARVIAYYRGALPLSGFHERSASSRQVLASSSKASVTVVANPAGSGTQIMIMVTDPTS